MSLMLSIHPLNSKRAGSGALVCGSGGARLPGEQCCGQEKGGFGAESVLPAPSDTRKGWNVPGFLPLIQILIRIS